MRGVLWRWRSSAQVRASPSVGSCFVAITSPALSSNRYVLVLECPRVGHSPHSHQSCGRATEYGEGPTDARAMPASHGGGRRAPSTERTSKGTLSAPPELTVSVPTGLEAPPTWRCPPAQGTPAGISAPPRPGRARRASSATLGMRATPDNAHMGCHRPRPDTARALVTQSPERPYDVRGWSTFAASLRGNVQVRPDMPAPPDGHPRGGANPETTKV